MGRLLSLVLPVVMVALAACGETVIIKSGKSKCEADCAGKQCGNDGCGGTCGTCGIGLYCLNWQCIVGTAPEDLDGILPLGDTTAPDDDISPIADLGTEESLPDTSVAPDTSKPEDVEQDKGPAVPGKCFFVYDDADDDGFGALATKEEFCGYDYVPAGKSLKYGDCNDSDSLVNPGIPESCDDRDNDCDGVVDNGCDVDGDGYCTDKLPMFGVPAVCTKGLNDCNDFSASVFPGNFELPGDGLDNDCDGEVDETVQCPGTCTGQTVDAFLCAIEICSGQYQNASFSSPTGDNISSAWAAVNHFGSVNNDLAPLAPPSYSLFATGPAQGTSHSTDLSGGGTATDSFSGDTMYDAVEFVVTLTAPAAATGFSLDYVFMSEEYEEFIGTQFNDKFYILLKAPQTTQNMWTIINYTDCRDPSDYHDFIDPVTQKKQCYLAINTALSEPCSNVKTNISGTGFECGFGGAANGSSTGWLYTNWSINGGETFQLKFHIHDTSDGIYDSLVILDNFHWLTGEFTQGTASHN